MDGIAEFSFQDRDWGEIKIARVLPRDGDPWGILSPLQGTIWGSMIIQLSGDLFSEALHGRVLPLIRKLGIPPEIRAQRIPDKEGICREIHRCLIAGSDCRPCKKVPDCYAAPHPDPLISQGAATVALAWKENRYVVVVIGDEFVV